MVDPFISQRENLLDSLAERGILIWFQTREINVTHIARRLSNHKNDHDLELDFLLVSESELVVGAVKTTMGVADVNTFREKLASF